MSFERSRSEFLKHSAVLTALSAGVWYRTATAAGRATSKPRPTFGRVRGVDAGGIKTFKGIPYGASTAGKNRFMPPVDPAKWTGVRDALAYGPSAPQREPGARGATAIGPRGRGRGPAGRGRRLPRAQRLDAGGRRRPQAAGDVLVPRRRVRDRLGIVAGHRRHEPRAPRRRGRRDDQSPARTCSASRPSASSAAPSSPQSGDVGMLDIVHALQVGARQHRAVRRRSEHRHDLRPVGRRPQGRDAARDAVGEGPVPPRDHRERRHDQARGARAGARASRAS